MYDFLMDLWQLCYDYTFVDDRLCTFDINHKFINIELDFQLEFVGNKKNMCVNVVILL